MFKVNVIEGGNGMAEALIYKPPPPNVVQYLQENLNHVISGAKTLGTRFVDTVKEMYNSVHSDEARQKAKMLLYQAGNHLSQNIIIPVPYERLHLANQTMQGYILVHPEVSELYRKKVCYGYHDTYVPLEPNCYGEDTSLYHQVMDGVMQWDSNGEAYTKTVSQDDEFIGGDLHYMDQLSILRTWDQVTLMLANGLDPTDPSLEEI